MGHQSWKTGLNSNHIRRHWLFFHYQANQRVRVPLPLLLPTVLGPLSDVVSQATKFTAEHHGLYSVVQMQDVLARPMRGREGELSD